MSEDENQNGENENPENENENEESASAENTDQPAEENENLESSDEIAASADDNFVPEDLSQSAEPRAAADLSLDVVMDVPVKLSLQVGKTSIQVRDLLALVEGSVVELDRATTEPMDVLVNDKLVARGEIVVVSDNFGVRLTDVVMPATSMVGNA